MGTEEFISLLGSDFAANCCEPWFSLSWKWVEDHSYTCSLGYSELCLDKCSYRCGWWPPLSQLPNGSVVDFTAMAPVGWKNVRLVSEMLAGVSSWRWEKPVDIFFVCGHSECKWWNYFPLESVMVNSVCQLDKAIDFWSNILGVSVRMFLDEINIWINRLIKAMWWTQPNQLKAWIEQKSLLCPE